MPSWRGHHMGIWYRKEVWFVVLAIAVLIVCISPAGAYKIVSKTYCSGFDCAWCRADVYLTPQEVQKAKDFFEAYKLADKICNEVYSEDVCKLARLLGMGKVCKIGVKLHKFKTAIDIWTTALRTPKSSPAKVCLEPLIIMVI